MSRSALPEAREERGTEGHAWERAYLRFETPAEERRKFARRLCAAGMEGWNRDAVILDLFSGRGGGAQTLSDYGFRNVVSLDLSPRLLRARENGSQCSVADCRELPIASRSVDIAIVQGGLHHLPRIPDDLSSTLREVARALKPNGIFVAVEPWRTRFLTLAHWVCGLPVARRASAKIDALATMIEIERPTYEMWLASPREILSLIDRYFIRTQLRIRLGKILYVGRLQAR
jgi:SAM-dependent methyltransferase